MKKYMYLFVALYMIASPIAYAADLGMDSDGIMTSKRAVRQAEQKAAEQRARRASFEDGYQLPGRIKKSLKDPAQEYELVEKELLCNARELIIEKQKIIDAIEALVPANDGWALEKRVKLLVKIAKRGSQKDFLFQKIS